jgi:hypothetical protein
MSAGERSEVERCESDLRLVGSSEGVEKASMEVMVNDKEWFHGLRFFSKATYLYTSSLPISFLLSLDHSLKIHHPSL